MNVKKLCVNTSLALLLGLTCYKPIGAIEQDSFIYDTSTTEFDIFDDFNIETNNILDSTHFDVIKAPTPDIIIDIIKMVGGLELLQQDFYLHTYRLNRRNILDIPNFLQDLDYRYDEWTRGIKIFYDETTQANFTSKDSHLDHYLAINNDNIIEAFKIFIDKVRVLDPNFDIPLIDLFELMGKTKVQERRAGIMFNGAKQLNRSRFVYWLPFMYDELNYFLTDKERAAIEELVGATSPEDEDELTKNHLLSDKVGFGDFRFAFDFPIICNNDFELDLGTQITLPTAFALKKGLMGSSYKDKFSGQPTFSFVEFFDLASNPDTQALAADEAMEFFLGALDRLSAILLDRGLGNEGHLGVALYANTRTPLSYFIKRPWAHSILLKGRIVLEYLFPKIQRRYFIERNPKEEFNSRNFCDPNQAAENLAFLEQVFVNKFYPFVIDATVHPGLLLWWTSKMTYENDYFAFHLGTDTWVRTPESLNNICASPGLRSQINAHKAKGMWAYQSSLIGSGTLKIHRPNSDLLIGLDLYTNLMTRGIGEQVTISLTIESNF